MTETDVIDISSQMIWVIIKCAAPLLLVSLIVGGSALPRGAPGGL